MKQAAVSCFALILVLMLGLALTSCGEKTTRQQEEEPLNRTPPSGNAHHGDMSIDPAAISQTSRLGDRSFSPYANRKFPTRSLWGDQHVHSGWSFDAGFINSLSPEAALRFARGEQVETTWGVPIQLSRPLD